MTRGAVGLRNLVRQMALAIIWLAFAGLMTMSPSCFGLVNFTQTGESAGPGPRSHLKNVFQVVSGLGFVAR